MKKSILISLAALVALAFSCTPEPTLSVSPTSLTAGADAGSVGDYRHGIKRFGEGFNAQHSRAEFHH